MDLELTDETLLSRARVLAADSRRTTAELLVLLLQVEDRRLHLSCGYATLFSYCVGELRFSEGEAGNRVMAARAARRFSLVLELLQTGEVNLTTVRVLGPHLTDENHAQVLRSACGRTRREVEELVVRLSPRPVPPAAVVRSQPAPALRQSVPLPCPPAPATVRPVTPEVYRLSVNMSAEAKRLWTRLRELPPSDDAALLERALREAVEALEKKRLGRVEKPRPRPLAATSEHSRHVPAEIKRVVSARDGDRCAYVSATGKRCDERRFLQFHHLRSWMTGGPTTVENLELRCAAHNRYEANLFYPPLRAQAHGLNQGS